MGSRAGEKVRVRGRDDRKPRGTVFTSQPAELCSPAFRDPTAGNYCVRYSHVAGDICRQRVCTFQAGLPERWWHILVLKL